MTMAAEKLRISADEINSPQVDEKLKQHQLVKGTREHYETVQVVAAAPSGNDSRCSTTPSFTWAVRDLGGLLGWGCGRSCT